MTAQPHSATAICPTRQRAHVDVSAKARHTVVHGHWGEPGAPDGPDSAHTVIASPTDCRGARRGVSTTDPSAAPDRHAWSMIATFIGWLMARSSSRSPQPRECSADDESYSKNRTDEQEWGQRLSEARSTVDPDPGSSRSADFLKRWSRWAWRTPARGHASTLG
jgi:hypothetical protein